TFADGLWDVFIGCFALQFAIAPLLSESLGDFWSSAIFLPFWAAVYLVIWLVRKHIVAPRLGAVTFRKARQQKITRFTFVMLAVNVLVALMGILVALVINRSADADAVARTGLVISLMLGLFLLAGFSAAAYLLDCGRLFFYGLILFVAPFFGEWLYQHHGAAHHGYPIAFGFTAGVMIVTGLVLFVRLLINNPRVEMPAEGG
ncbi:MAG: hypothetical protein JW726_13595, partial [Anaerolineales bacterium]|nr:hypothetical protein [Anaerolineales bacterium]